MSLFRSTQVNLPPLVLAKLVELHRPVVVHLHHEAPGPLRLEGAQDVHHGELVRLLAQVDVGTLPPGVAGVLGPGVVIWLPSVQFLPAEVAPHQIRLVLSAAAVEACQSLAAIFLAPGFARGHSSFPRAGVRTDTGSGAIKIESTQCSQCKCMLLFRTHNVNA